MGCWNLYKSLIFSQNNNNYNNGYGDYHDYQNDTQDEFDGYPDRTYVLPQVSLTESPIIDQNRNLNIK